MTNEHDSILKNITKENDTQLEQFFLSIRKICIGTDTKLLIPTTLLMLFNPKYSQVYITLFQEGLKSIRWGSRKETIQLTIFRVIECIQKNSQYEKFDITNQGQCRILFEMVTDERECDITKVTTNSFVSDRFEPGVTGLKYIHNNVVRYFMPTDAIVRSIMSKRQLLNYLSKQTGIAKVTNSINKRIELMHEKNITYKHIESIAFISYYDQVIPLYRGYPKQIVFNRDEIKNGFIKSVDWLVKNLNSDGSFLYYYDGIEDSTIDFAHPSMKNPPYYNILRHSGGIITLLHAYEQTRDDVYLNAAEVAINFLRTTFREHIYKKEKAYYPFFNKKSKLGGAGIALVALMHFYIHTNDKKYCNEINGLVNHILSRIDTDGEMIGYYIHPDFNNGEPLNNPPFEIKKELFSFYYPGEALLGLALYFKYMQDIDIRLKEDIREKSIKALDFLVDIRPIKYKEMFTPLPADAWLMQAIEEWMDIDDFKKDSYINFVIGDADTMLRQMYTEENAPYPDYIGGFYYYYGEHVYQDASRCEGLMAAYHVVKKLGQKEKELFYMKHILKAAQGIMFTRHTEESTYAHKYPQKSINSFRFKLTRQWVRVDSVQHAACFYARVLKEIS